MKLSQEGLFRRSVHTAVIAGLAGTTGPVIAQTAGDSEATQLDRVVVTGSRIRRVDLEAASPVFVVDRNTIEASGVATVGQLLQAMPTIAGGATNPQVNNGGGSGAAEISLRGLGEDRTLLLLNGRRLITQDANAIPINLIERVEILKDGASAIYGSDAIAGVVNFITRTKFIGSEFAAGSGFSERRDGELSNLWGTYGMTGPQGSLVFGANYDHREKISSADRSFSEDPRGLYYGEGIIFGSSRIPNGRFVVSNGAGGTFDCDGDGDFTQDVNLIRRTGEDGRDISDYRCFIGGGPNNDTFDFQDDNVNMTPQERLGLFFSGDYALPMDVSWSTEVMYHNTDSAFQIAPEPFDGRPAQADVPADANSVFNPFGETLTDVRKRMVDVGNRTERFSTDRVQLTTGLDGTFLDDAWTWDAAITFGELRQTSEAFGELYTPALLGALGPSYDAADNNPFADADGDGNPIDDPQCGSMAMPIANCTPIDFFGNPDPAALLVIAPKVHDRQENSLRNLQLNVSGDAYQLPAGPLGVAAGFESRAETLDFQPDFLRQQAFISGNSSQPIKGSTRADEFYLEGFIPVVAGYTGVEALNVSLGVRFSDYDTFGNTTNGKLGIEYRPIEDLLVRANYADVFRAPTIIDLFQGQDESADTFTDPCNGLTTAVGVNANIDAACQNVPRDGSFAQTDTQLQGIVGGNPKTQPEEGNASTFGIVYSPSWFEPLTVEIDYWNFQLDDAIGTVGASLRLQQCFDNGLFCDSISRDASGEIFTVTDTTDNVGSLDATGVDLGFKLDLGERQIAGMDLGRYFLSVDSTYLMKWDNEQLAGDPATLQENAGRFVDVSAGGDGHFARWRGVTHLDWKMQNWNVRWSTRYIHGVTEIPGDFAESPGECNRSITNAPITNVRCNREVGSQWIHGLVFNQAIPAFGTTVSVGIDNVTDRLAPIVYSGFNGSTDVRTYDTIGRYYWARLKFEFQ